MNHVFPKHDFPYDTDSSAFKLYLGVFFTGKNPSNFPLQVLQKDWRLMSVAQMVNRAKKLEVKIELSQSTKGSSRPLLVSQLHNNIDL